MKREIIKAVTGFFILGIILGGTYYVLNFVIFKKTDSKESIDNYNIERIRVSRERLFSSRIDQDVSFGDSEGDVENEEENGKISELVVRGIIRNKSLENVVNKTIEVTLDREKKLALKQFEPELGGGWFVSPSLKDVEEVSISLEGRDFVAGPFGAGLSKGEIRFNWNLGGSGKQREKLCFLDIVSVEAGGNLKIYFNGRADLPDKTLLIISLVREGRRWTGQAVEVEEKSFSGIISAEESGYPSGIYVMELDFNSLDQTSEVLDHFKKDVPTLNIRSEICIGDLSKVAEERSEERKILQDIVKQAQKILHRYVCLCRLGITAKGRPMALLQNARRFYPDGIPPLSSDGMVDTVVWRFWIDEIFTPDLDRLDELFSFREVPVDVESHVLVKAYLKEIRRLIKVGSQLVYSVSGLNPDEKDFCRISLTLADEFQGLVEKLAGKKAFGRVVSGGLEGMLKKELFQ